MICLKLIIDGNAVYEIDEECLKRMRCSFSGKKEGSEPQNSAEKREKI
ncbi:MAG TPA: hypothetical protein IAA51_00585 [Candidatus Cottocaccamicrobium excrementipullorum]|nr:hypothetical protein [Candidatus Cottocaccamicrobium excrementipullorum]